MHVALAPELSKDEREAAINQKIEEIRQKNASINRRYQEIENDKKNAENFSLEAKQRAKTRPDNEENNCRTLTETSPNEKQTTIIARAAKESRRIKQVTPSITPVTTDFRPQRLSESDLPPPDPVFSYLTDRLREGAFCAPISPVARRKQSTSSQGSEMSIGGSSRSSNSRRTSTTSNSSWTSDTSSKYCGFSNYQPPRKYSACHNYVRNRRMSEQPISSVDRENSIWQDKQLIEIERTHYPDAQKSSENNPHRHNQQDKTTRMSGDTNTTHTSFTSACSRGSTRPTLRRASSVTSSPSENVSNWRDRRISYNSTEELGFTFIQEGVTARSTAADEDVNNNGDMINHNLLVPEAAHD